MSSPRWLLGALWVCALANALDDVPRPPPQDWAIESLSAADRHDASLSSRERGLARQRRGALHLPDLYGFLAPPTIGESGAIELDARLSEGAWLDLIVDAEGGRRTVERLSTKAGESWIASVDDAATEAPDERALAVAPGCLTARARVRITLAPDLIRTRVGDCPEVVVARPGRGGRAGIVAGLGALEVRSFEIQATGTGASESYRLAARGWAIRCLENGGLAGLGLALFALYRRVRTRLRAGSTSMRPAPGTPPGTLTVAALTFSALPVVPWFVNAPALILAGLASRVGHHPVTSTSAATATLGPRSRSLTWLHALLATVAIVAATVPRLFSAGVDHTPLLTVLDGPAPRSWSPSDEELVAGGRATTLDVELLADGAVAAYVDAPPTEPGLPLRPSLYPDLGSMAPGLVLERAGDELSWTLVVGDVVRHRGRVPAPGPLRLGHRAGGIELSHGNETLARIDAVPARDGRVRIVPVLGRPTVRAEIRRPHSATRLMGLLAFLVPLGALILIRTALVRIPSIGTLADEIVRPAIGAWFALALVALLLGPGPPILVANVLIPCACVLGPLLSAATLVVRRRLAGGIATARMVTIALVAPNLLLTLAGGPGGPRFTQPWFGVSSSDAVLGYLDPEQRLFSDTALTGRYRQVDEGRRTQPETKRVVVLGGSQTYGEGFTGSAHPPIWTERLGAAHPEWTIVNLAVQGSTLASQTIRLEHYAQVHPDQHTDAIVAVFGLNDLAFLRADPRREDRNAAVRRGELSPLAADPCAYLAACSGPRLLGRAVPFFLGRRVGADAEKLAAVERALRKLAALGHDWGATLVLVREPHQCELTSCADTIAPYDYPSAFDRARPVLDELARQPSVRLVDPALWLRARRATQPFFDAVHFSEAGHDAMAGALDPALDEALR